MQLETIKGKVFDILIIGLALIIANNIYNAQSKRIIFLKEQKEIELKRQEVLIDINKSYSKISTVKAFINKKEISAVVNSLTDIAKDCYVQIDSLKPKVEEKYNEFTLHPFELSVNTDSYHKLGKFISRLESSEDFYTIRNLDVHISERFNQGQNRFIANLVLTTVLIKD